MKMKGLRKSIFLTLPFLALVFCTAISGSTLFAIFAAFGLSDSTVNASYAYNWTDDESVVHNETAYFTLYPVSSGYTGSRANPVAIGWDRAHEASETADVLKIPESLTVSGTTYNIVGIAPTGFRYCDFSKIELPNDGKGRYITEIGKQAFYLCQNLTEFTFPYNVTEIPDSCFTDCRNLETLKCVKGKDNGTITTGLKDSRITAIGDHAFTSCVKLKNLDAPSGLLTIGNNAFQNCASFTRFFTPTTVTTLGHYAFADCKLMGVFSFGSAVTSVGEFAFVEDTKLTLFYNGTPEDFEAQANVNKKWRLKYLGKKGDDLPADYVESDKIPFEEIDGEIKDTNSYPGLYFVKMSDITKLKLDQATSDGNATIYRSKTQKIGSTTFTVDSNTAPAGTKKYAQIFRFDPPEEPAADKKVGDDPNHYLYPGYLEYTRTNAESPWKISLTIPNILNDGEDLPVRVIGAKAFENHTELIGVTFNANLVQICHEAFYHCTNIAELDFDLCETTNNFIEISYNVFQGKATKGEADPEKNTAFTGELDLPDCLKYIGYHAFYNFTKVTDLHLPANCVMMGEGAFENLGSDTTGPAEVDLLLPRTLRDAMVGPSSGGGFKTARLNLPSWDEPVGVACFKNARIIRSVTMEPIDADLKTALAANKTHANFKPFRIGVQISAFEGCENLIRFRGNDLLYVIGKDAFKGCTSLKELFLTRFGTNCSDSKGKYYWGFELNSSDNNEYSIFGKATSVPDAVIYVDGDSAPNNNGSEARTTKWNSDTQTFPNEFASPSLKEKNQEQGRAFVPTYYNASFSDVKYYDLSDGSVLTGYTEDQLNSGEHFRDKNLIAFVENASGERTLTHCYTKENIASIDLTSLALGTGKSITTIGEGAFARETSGTIPGTSIIIPDTVTAIKERAFYRRDNSLTNTRGLQVINFKTGGVLDTPLTTTSGYYCNLPSSVTRIERFAFYDNVFEKVKIAGNLVFFGNSVFAGYPYFDTDGEDPDNTASRATIEEVTLAGTQNKFAIGTSGGLYHTATKTLMYQPTAGSGTLTLDDGTVSIAPRAVANSNYTGVSLDTALTTIYPGAFSRSLDLETVTVPSGSGITHIGAKKNPASGEVVDASSFDIVDGSSIEDMANSYLSNYGSFSQCKSLTTLNFRNLTNLVKIGYGAFEDCTSLNTMVGDAKYTYYKWVDKTKAAAEDGKGIAAYAAGSEKISTGILDLSGCSSLTVIGERSFNNCTSIKYCHLPDRNRGLYLGIDNLPAPSNGQSESSGSVFTGMGGDGGATVLVGETCHTASHMTSDDNKWRYPKSTFGSKIKAYYRTGTGKSGNNYTDMDYDNTLRYWYQLQASDTDYDATKGAQFVLFENRANAENFFKYRIR